MRKQLLQNIALAAALAVGLLVSQPAMAGTIYNDATSDVFTTSTFDISSVEITNNATDLIFTINLVGDPVADTSVQPVLGIDTPPLNSGGDTAGNGWTRQITMATGMDFWVGSWVNSGGGGQLWQYSGTWANILGVGNAITTSNVTLTVSYVGMGLSAGDTIQFDVFTTSTVGGGDTNGPADSLAAGASQTITAWTQGYNSPGNLSYTLASAIEPTNQVFFQVDMQAPVAIFNEGEVNENGFDPSGDQVYVRGPFNGWAASPSAEYELFRDGTTTVFTNTVAIVGTNGSTIDYKFYSPPFLNEEDTLLADPCNAVRKVVVTNTTLTAPLAYWSDRTTNDPTIALTYSCDMSLQQQQGNFTGTGTDPVQLRGEFNGWGSTSPMTNDPAASNTNLFTFKRVFDYTPLAACTIGGPYKFYADELGGYEEPLSTGGANRVAVVDSTNTVLEFFWADLAPCDLAETNVTVTFSIDMTGAIGTDATSYTGAETIYINGPWATTNGGFWGWGGPPAEFALTKVGATDVHTITLTDFPSPGGPIFATTDAIALIYKYSIGGADNEGGFQTNHVRYIRTDSPTDTDYTMPEDVWINTNPGVEREESQLGDLGIAKAGGATIDLNWVGLPCTMMQGASTITGPWSDLFEARGVLSTNQAAGASQQYYRLTR